MRRALLHLYVVMLAYQDTEKIVLEEPEPRVITLEPPGDSSHVFLFEGEKINDLELTIRSIEAPSIAHVKLEREALPKPPRKLSKLKPAPFFNTQRRRR